ncbi:MAG: GNAT family N-acetyltransferase [Candidatus Absconditicoccaceae bacterium]
MNNSQEIRYGPAKKSDIQGVMNCMQANLFDNLDNKDNGRLYYPVSEKEFGELIQDPNIIFFCAKQGNYIKGYALGYNLKKWILKKQTRMDDIQVSQEIRKIIENKKTFYRRHVAIHPDHQGNGISKGLELSTFQEAKKQGYEYIVAEIMKKPIENIQSLQVHKKIGLKNIGEISYEDLTTRYLLRMKI